jgi:RHS repeat-associated protein
LDVLKRSNYPYYTSTYKDFYLLNNPYGFHFNGKENDNETQTQDYGFRIYDYRLGRFLSVDPLAKSYAFYTPYQFAGNKPIVAVDLDGREDYWIHLKSQNNGTTIQTTAEDDVQSFTLRLGLAISGKNVSNVPKTGSVVTYEESDGTISVKSYIPTVIITAKAPPSFMHQEGKYPLEGSDNGGNDRVASGGPDAAGMAFGADVAMIGGGQLSRLETDKGTKNYLTLKTTFGGLGWFGVGPSFELNWKTEQAKNQSASDLIPGKAGYISIGFGISFTYSASQNEKTGETVMRGLSIGIGTGIAAGQQYTFKSIGAPKEESTEKE